MSDKERDIDWSRTTFDGSRREQLRRAQAMTVRERLAAMAELSELGRRLQAISRDAGSATTTTGVYEGEACYGDQRPENEMILGGCAPTPLAAYLKAVGVLRLLAVKDPSVRAAWRGERFVLHTTVDRAAVEDFFLNEYQPTPIMAPWNGGSGFFENDNKQAMEAISNSGGARFSGYRNCLSVAERCLSSLSRESSPKNKDKSVLMTRVRASLPDDALDWFDAAVLMAGDSPQYPPLLGTGGNDGRLDFTNNFMQRLVEVIALNDGDDPPSASRDWLRMSLFGTPAPGLMKKPIGQFSPGQAGGVNATSGFDADAAINPWDFVIMIEGSLAFAAAAVRRNADDPQGVLSFPFTVRAVGAGAGNLGTADAAPDRARGELWMPLWKRPVSYAEIHALLSEGRVALGRKPARDALDFVRAVHRLGVYRGVDAFQRFGLLMRSGKAYFATPLERVVVSNQPQAKWLDDLDQRNWLSTFRRFARNDSAATRFAMLRRRLEDALFELAAREPSAAEMQTVLALLADIHSALAQSKKAQEIVEPVPALSGQWVQAADDGSPAFRIARALAGLQGVRETPLPLRAQLFPVHPRWHHIWMTPEYVGKHASQDPLCRVRMCVGQKGSLVETLTTLLARRLWLAEKLEMPDKPFNSPAGVTVSDVSAFLRDPGMDARIAALLPGLSLCRIPRDVEHRGGEGSAPAAFALLKLCLTPNAVLRELAVLAANTRLPTPAGLVSQLVAGNANNGAVTQSWRRLRSSGLSPVFAPGALPALGDIASIRAAAALLIPLRFGATAAMARNVLAAPDNETEVA